jgi:hypothetical protein
MDVYEITSISKESTSLQYIGGHLFGRKASFHGANYPTEIPTLALSEMLDTTAYWTLQQPGQRYSVKDTFTSDSHHAWRTPRWEVGRVLVIDKIDSYEEMVEKPPYPITFAGVYFRWEDNGEEAIVPVGVFDAWYMRKLVRL